MRPAALRRSDRARGALYWAATGLLAAMMAVTAGGLLGWVVSMLLEALAWGIIYLTPENGSGSYLLNGAELAAK